MKPFTTIKDCWKEWWSYILRFWGFFGLSGIFGIIGILILYREIFWILIIYYSVIVPFPFVYYGKYYEYLIKIIEKEPRCRRDNKEIESFHIYSDKNTISNFKLRVGEKISGYYLFFSKSSDVIMEFTLPNKNFKQIKRRHKEFYIVKCVRNEKKKTFFWPINSFNKSGQSFTITFKIFYSKEESFENALMKMKRIYKGSIQCDP